MLKLENASNVCKYDERNVVIEPLKVFLTSFCFPRLSLPILQWQYRRLALRALQNRLLGRSG